MIAQHHGEDQYRTIQVRAQNTGKCMEDQSNGVHLHLGSGKCHWGGWVNIDGSNNRADVICNIQDLPFGCDYADRIAAIHVFEHFYQWEAIDLLREWRRVLKPGGKLILEMPCMDLVFSHIAACLMKGVAPNKYLSWLPLWGDPRYKDPSMCHKWGYFKNDVASLLSEAGFIEIKQEEPRYHFKERDMRVTARKAGA